MNKQFIIFGVIAALGAFFVFSKQKKADGSSIEFSPTGPAVKSMVGGMTIDEIDSIESLAAIVGDDYRPPLYQDIYNPGVVGLEAGLEVFGSPDDIPEGLTGVVMEQPEGFTQPVPVFVEKYKGMNIFQPIEVRPSSPISPEQEAASQRSVKQLIDTIQASGLDTTDPTDLKTIGQIDTQIRLTEYADSGVRWEETHADITDIGQRIQDGKGGTSIVATEFTKDTAKRWLAEIDTFRSQGGIVDPSTVTRLQAVASGGITVLKRF